VPFAQRALCTVYLKICILEVPANAAAEVEHTLGKIGAHTAQATHNTRTHANKPSATHTLGKIGAHTTHTTHNTHSTRTLSQTNTHTNEPSATHTLGKIGAWTEKNMHYCTVVDYRALLRRHRFFFCGFIGLFCGDLGHYRTVVDNRALLRTCRSILRRCRSILRRYRSVLQRCRSILRSYRALRGSFWYGRSLSALLGGLQVSFGTIRDMSPTERALCTVYTKSPT
jgi:hypothetical protein